MGKLVYDLTGQRFGRLLVLRRTEEKARSHGKKYECLCDCGNIHIASTYNLQSGKTKSCGCLQRERFATGPRNIVRRKFPPKEDCFAFRGDHCDCLTEMVCKKNGKCGFYKKG